MVSNHSLDKLSTELLLKIFSYLDLKDLCHLKRSCKRFKEIIISWDNVLFKDLPVSLVTNQINDKFFLKCSRRLGNLDKLRISRNWRTAKYFEESLFYSRKKFIPFLQLSDRYLWLSRGADINCYERIYSSLNVGRPVYVLRGKSTADVVNFQQKNDFVVSGLRDGTIWLKNINDQNTIFELQNCHKSDVHSVDLSEDGCMVVSGSRDGGLKIWKIAGGDPIHNSFIAVQCPDLVWKVSLSEENQLAVGTAGNEYRSSLFVYNVERMANPVELCFSDSVIGGILDIRWDGLQTLWSCGYDACLRRWDLRTGKSEQSFMDPCVSALYCLDYDYHNTIMTGAQLHGRVILWDIRQCSAVQMYFMESCKKRYNRSSPVYSLAFDAEFLFTATDQNLNVLDFSVYEASSNDYAFFLK